MKGLDPRVPSTDPSPKQGIHNVGLHKLQIPAKSESLIGERVIDTAPHMAKKAAGSAQRSAFNRALRGGGYTSEIPAAFSASSERSRN